MPNYYYTYIDKNGIKKSSCIEGTSLEEVERKFDIIGVALIEIKEVNKKTVHNKKTAHQGKVRRRELIEFCIYLGALSNAGLSLVDALSDYASEIQNPAFKKIVESLSRGIKNGQTLSEGMSQYPRVFSKEFIHLIHAGEQTGTLPRSFKELRSYLEWLERINGDIKQATIYPLLVTIVLALFILFLFSSVVPKITSILIEMKVELPLITRVIMIISSISVRYWWLILLVTTAIPLAIKILARKSMAASKMIDSLKLRIPVFGILLQIIIQARFTQNFAVLHRAGISILENLQLCKGFIGNQIYAIALQKAYQEVTDGGSLSTALKNCGLFSGLVVRMFSVGEVSGDLENSLTNAAAYYDEEVPRRVKRAFSVLEPLIIISLVAVVGAVALAVFLPILSMSDGLR